MLGQLPGMLRQALANPGSRSAFVVVNLAVNALFLARSYVAMLVFDYWQLGLVAVLQTVMALVAALHFGLLNGGYRLLCSEAGESARGINTAVYTFIALLGGVSLLAGAAYLVFGTWSVVTGFALLGVVAGMLTLLRSWITNQLLATGQLTQLNGANINSVLVSLLPLALIPWAPLPACVASILVQPLAFALLAWRTRPELRPRALGFSGPLFRALLHSGFLVFMTGVLLQLIAQAERWYVVKYLGLESLGRLYLAIMFVTVFQLVPASLDNVVLPRLVRDYEAGNAVAVRRELRRLFALCAGYCLFALLAVWLLAAPVVQLALPRYVDDLQYVYLVLPGLILFTLAGPFGIVFNVLIRYKAFMVAYGGGFLLALAAFGFAAWHGGALDLRDVVLTRSTVLAVMAALLVALYLRTVRFFPALALHRAPDVQPS
jgi:O-antigen/teichoic acid export membrane protein